MVLFLTAMISNFYCGSHKLMGYAMTIDDDKDSGVYHILIFGAVSIFCLLTLICHCYLTWLIVLQLFFIWVRHIMSNLKTNCVEISFRVTWIIYLIHQAAT